MFCSKMFEGTKNAVAAVEKRLKVLYTQGGRLEPQVGERGKIQREYIVY